MAELDVVTGAFSFTGRHITEALLERGRRVRTLTRRPDPSHPLSSRVETAPLAFDDSLVESLRGADTLYNTYWVRFERGQSTFARAVQNIGVLIDAALRAGVRRVVHVSVANPDERSPFPYFRGKARAEALVRESGLAYAIVRPTLVFGADDILVSNIAWILRRMPLFLVAGDGRYEVQPVSVDDTARICVEAGGLRRRRRRRCGARALRLRAVRPAHSGGRRQPGAYPQRAPRGSPARWRGRSARSSTMSCSRETSWTRSWRGC